MHGHILDDLCAVELDDQIKYITEGFGRLIAVELKEDVEAANLSEEFLRELEQEEWEEKQREREERIELEQELHDMDRESAGLSALGDYESKLEDSFADSDFQSHIIDAFDRISKCYMEAEELWGFYIDELLPCINDIELNKAPEFTLAFKTALTVAGSDDAIEYKNHISDLFEIKEWVERQKEWVERQIERLEPFTEEKHLDDYVKFGEDVDLFDWMHHKIRFSIDGLDYLSPSDGDSDQINITVKIGASVVAQGYVSVSYGYADIDEDGGAGNSYPDDIEYSTEEIENYITDIADEWEKFISRHRKIESEMRSRLSI